MHQPPWKPCAMAVTKGPLISVSTEPSAKSPHGIILALRISNSISGRFLWLATNRRGEIEQLRADLSIRIDMNEASSTIYIEGGQRESLRAKEALMDFWRIWRALSQQMHHVCQMCHCIHLLKPVVKPPHSRRFPWILISAKNALAGRQSDRWFSTTSQPLVCGQALSTRKVDRLFYLGEPPRRYEFPF